MFTGIVEELGQLAARDGARLRIRARTVLSDATLGASIAVNGCCLTVVAWDPGSTDDDGWWDADVSDETFARTNLGALRVGDPVNLERPVRLDDRLGGHLVQGHVDGVGTVIAREPAEKWEIVKISLPAAISRYVVEKGSITVDGISLTVTQVEDTAAGSAFSVSLIPTTLELTTLGRKGPGDQVNLEVDVIAKYVERLFTPGER